MGKNLKIAVLLIVFSNCYTISPFSGMVGYRRMVKFGNCAAKPATGLKYALQLASPQTREG
jgi:hypothetical protein